MKDPLCARPGMDPEWWFPDRRTAARRAVRLCRHCPLMESCALAAIEAGHRYGIWGGTTPEQRQVIWAAAREHLPQLLAASMTAGA